VIFTKCLVNFFFVCEQILLINFKKEILAFVPKEGAKSNIEDDSSNECSSVLVVGESMAIVAHNEDANVNLVGHT
jgi:hypothetical protein